MSEYNSYNQPQYQGQQSTGASSYEEAVSVKEWLLTYLILLIPCVGTIMLFVWAFSSSEKKSKSNYFKAILIIDACVGHRSSHPFFRGYSYCRFPSIRIVN